VVQSRGQGKKPHGGWTGSSELAPGSVGSIPWSAARRAWWIALGQDAIPSGKHMRGERELNGWIGCLGGGKGQESIGSLVE